MIFFKIALILLLWISFIILIVTIPMILILYISAKCNPQMGACANPFVLGFKNGLKAFWKDDNESYHEYEFITRCKHCHNIKQPLYCLGK